MSRKFVYYGAGKAGGLDPDALAFLTATAITDPTITTAIDTLVKDLKIYGIWSKMKAIYPFVGGTAATHKYNLKDPRDLDVAFRLSFIGGATHDTNGFQPNGINGYADTNINYFNEGVDANSFHAAFYINNNSNKNIDYGADAGSGLFYLTSRSSVIGNSARFQSETASNVADSDSLGYYLGNKQDSTTRRLLKNNTLIQELISAATGNFANINAYLGALNRSGSASFYSDKRYAMLHTGEGLINTDEANLYTIIQNFQTTLGREV